MKNNFPMWGTIEVSGLVLSAVSRGNKHCIVLMAFKDFKLALCICAPLLSCHVLGLMGQCGWIEYCFCNSVGEMLILTGLFELHVKLEMFSVN